MAYVIAKPCVNVKDTACLIVCPVDCIHPTATEPGFAATDQLFIDPNVCTDCSLCAAECPVNAIFQDSDLPSEWAEYLEKNARYFEQTASNQANSSPTPQSSDKG